MSSTNIEVLIAGNNSFTLDLYAKLKSDLGNLFFSPFSITTTLAMTYAGARDTTAAQMEAVLHFRLKPETVHQTFKILMTQLLNQEQTNEYHLNLANALWIQEKYKLLQEFLALIHTNYGEAIFSLDFTEDEVARRRINGWVEEQTRGKIKELIPPGALVGALLVLVNAIYFKGMWHLPFKENNTRPSPFTLITGKKVDSFMMHQTETFGYYEDGEVQVLDLPYAGKKLAMTIMLPKNRVRLGILEEKLASKRLSTWFSKIHQRKVRVYLPRFRITSFFLLNSILQNLGMVEAFSIDSANFTGMTREPDLFIGKVFHQAFIDVNEEGTEAAAATAVVMLPRAIRPDAIPVFRADHPFLFLIRDVKNNNILFIGRVMDPTA